VYVRTLIHLPQEGELMDQEKDANPIAEIFDEAFTLMEDLETRSVAIIEYMKEQGGVSDEKLAPYLDRAAAASDVRWRAARARMEHLLAPKPKSATEVGNDQKAKGVSDSQSQSKGKEAESGKSKTQGDKEQRGSKADSKELGKELASTPSNSQGSAESEGDKSQKAKPASDTGPEKKNAGDGEQRKEAKSTSKGTESQAAAALGGQKKSDAEKSEGGNQQSAQSGDGKSANQSSGDEKQQTGKAAK
jgi:hypothetical protein